MKINREQIIQFLCEEGISYKEKNERGELLINSIFTNDSKQKMGINYKKNGIWNCFKSGNGGSFFSLIKSIKGLNSEKEAKLFFIKNYFSKEDMFNSIYQTEEEVVEKKYLELPEDYHPVTKGNEYYQYLLRRYFDDEKISESKIYFSFKEKRILFPVYENNKLIFYAKRSIDPNNPIRWINSSNEGSNAIWNLDGVGSEIYIFEGIFDAVRVWPKGVAIFGNTLRGGQEEKILSKHPYKITVVLDGDEAGRRGQMITAKKLSQKHGNVFVHLWNPQFKDFGEMNEIKVNPILFDTKGELLLKLNNTINQWQKQK